MSGYRVNNLEKSGEKSTTLPYNSIVEIDCREIDCLETVGEGTFGVVYKGIWRGKYVAVKTISSKAEPRRAFSVEVRQLSRVDHENIVKLYGVCTQGLTCLVMEYAEGGSLFNVLHCAPRVHYTIAHAMSWLYQCAKGVEYLHNMRPKPLIHRDLKPPNLLLINDGTLLKICDFGTAADKNTYMTNNKGSAAWMAPEVFSSSNYTEKCDVFSWGIILWEVLSRRKPFFNLGGTAYTIMWAVYKGNRPPLLQNCPAPIEHLIVACWDQMAGRRPSMTQIAQQMDIICRLVLAAFGGATPPLLLHQYDGGGDVEDEAVAAAAAETDLNEWGNEKIDWTNHHPEFTDEGGRSRRRVVLPQPHETMVAAPLTLEIEPNAWELTSNSSYYGEDFRGMRLKTMPGFDKMVPKNGGANSRIEAATIKSSPINSQSVSAPPPSLFGSTNDGGGGANADPPSAAATPTNPATAGGVKHAPDREVTANNPSDMDGCGPDSDLDQMYLLLDPHLRPATPNLNDVHSRELFEEHKKLAKEYLKVQTEVALLSQRKEQLLAEQSDEERTRHEFIRQLQKEKESLLMVRDLLQKQKGGLVGGATQLAHPPQSKGGG